VHYLKIPESIRKNVCARRRLVRRKSRCGTAASAVANSADDRNGGLLMSRQIAHYMSQAEDSPLTRNIAKAAAALLSCWPQL
jgi:hypothetical protein